MKSKCETKFHYFLVVIHFYQQITSQMTCRNLTSQPATKNLTLTTTSTIDYWRRKMTSCIKRNQQRQRIHQLCTYKLLYPPIGRITYEQLGISNSKTRILPTFFFNAIHECRWLDDGSITLRFSRHSQGWPTWTFPTSSNYITMLEPSSMHHIVCQSQAKNWSPNAISMKDWETIPHVKVIWCVSNNNSNCLRIPTYWTNK